MKRNNMFALINVLLSPDPVDGGNAASPEVDPLAEDVSGINTSFPVLPAGLYDLEIANVEVGPSKSNPNGETMKITMKTTEDAADTRGEHVNAGYPVYDYISLTETAGGKDEATGKVKQAYTLKDVAKKIAAVAKAAGLTGITARAIVDAKGEQFKARKVRVKLGISKETAEFSESNKVKQYIEVE